MKRTLSAGITGQGGSYLADLLIGKAYEVHGIVLRPSTFNHESLLRVETFVSRKIIGAAAPIKLGFQDRLYQGNLPAGYAPSARQERE